jgi:competence protein ComEC
VSIPDGVSDASGRLHETISAWAVAEVAPGRLMPWLPVAFGLGIAVYFTADREPALWTASALAFAATVVAVLTRRRAIAFPLALGLAAMGLGLAVSTLHTGNGWPQVRTREHRRTPA